MHGLLTWRVFRESGMLKHDAPKSRGRHAKSLDRTINIQSNTTYYLLDNHTS